MVVIATFSAATGWANKSITYENGVFTVDGHHTISVAALMGYDAAGQLTWASDALRAWVTSLAQKPVATTRRPNRRLIIIAAVIALVVVVAVVHAALGAGSSSGGGSGTWVKVFTWSGGGAADDIANSAPFSLQGGQQRIHVSSVAVGGDPDMVSLGWALTRVGVSGDSKTIAPTGVGESDVDLSLPGGYYTLSSDTVACTWVVTVRELR